MVNWKISTGAEQPINTSAALAGSKVQQGDLVGIDPVSGKMVKADADSASQVMAVGVAMGPIEDLADYAASPDAVKSAVEANRSLVDRDRLSAVSYGIEVEDTDQLDSLTAGEVVYLASGGGITQTAPAAVGDLVQIVGVALTANRYFLNVVPSATTA